MKLYLNTLKISIKLLALLSVLLGLIYPLCMWGVGQFLFHKKANGSLIYSPKGTILGSELIGQNFTNDKYFKPRPSAAGDKGYDASNSSASNLGPTSKKLVDSLKQRSNDYRNSNNLGKEMPIPSDAVTASGSGLDPHISLSNAKAQSARIAAARGLSQDQIEQLINKYKEGRTLWIFGEERVNVLLINLALDNLYTLRD
jgi:K+-transporting ATPase ATPase C chain